MVGALDRGDAVDLDEAQPLDQTCKIFSLRRAPEAVPVEEQLPGSPVGEARQRFADTATHETLAPIPRTHSQSPHSLQGQECFTACQAPHRPPANNDEPASEPAPLRVSLNCAGARCWQDRRHHRQLLEAVGFRARHHVDPPASRHGAGPLQTNTRECERPRLFAGRGSEPCRVQGCCIQRATRPSGTRTSVCEQDARGGGATGASRIGGASGYPTASACRPFRPRDRPSRRRFPPRVGGGAHQIRGHSGPCASRRIGGMSLGSRNIVCPCAAGS